MRRSHGGQLSIDEIRRLMSVAAARCALRLQNRLNDIPEFSRAYAGRIFCRINRRSRSRHWGYDMNLQHNRRILLIDDTPAIHDDFRKVLGNSAATSELHAVGAALFGDEVRTSSASFELDSAYQGKEGLAKVCDAVAAGRPYAMAFVDMRMPPGWDGVETIERLWKQDPLLQIVICTAYSDYAWSDVLSRLDVGDRMLVLKKPFDAIEVCQLASTLTAKWEMTRKAALKMAELETAVQARTDELKQTNDALKVEILERKQLECRLVQSEKLASLGHLAAGVAHEINNPIGFVFSNVGKMGSYLEACLSVISAYEENRSSIRPAEVVARLNSLCERFEIDYLRSDIPSIINETKEGIARVKQIVQDLRDFSRIGSNQDWQWANLHQCIDTTLNIAASEIKYKADVVKEYGEIPEIECLPSQLNQVIMNLVVNAAQAIETERGEIRIRTGGDGDDVWFEVADSGTGIAAKDLPHIFDPFFTTKPIGKGTGLGLSVSYGIIQTHQGHIGVHSEIGKGASFRVVLPIRHRA